MSVSGSRKSKELTEKYSKLVYGDSDREKKNIVNVQKRNMFCPKCKSYIPPHSKCGNCGYEPEEHLIMKKKTTRKMRSIDGNFLKAWREEYRWPPNVSRRGSEERILHLERLVIENILRSEPLNVKQVLTEIVEWKAPPQFRTQMLSNFNKNTEGFLKSRIAQVLSKLHSNPENVSACVDLLSSLDGVGIPVSSAFLRFLDPTEHKYGIIDKRVARFLNDREITRLHLGRDGSIKSYPESSRRININEYQRYHDWLQQKAKELKDVTYTGVDGNEQNFAPVDVEMAIFAYTTKPQQCATIDR